MILKRVLTALTTAAVFICAFLFVPLYALFPVVLVASCLVQAEFYIMAARRYTPAPYAGTLMGIAWLGFVFMFPMFSLGRNAPAWSMMFLAALLFFFLVYVLFQSKIKRPIETLGVTLLGFFYVPFLLSFFLRVVQLTADQKFGMPETRQGLWVLFFIVAVVKISDMGGFAFGKGFGRHKLCPSISPNKSWEGLFGGIFSSVLISVLFHWISTVNGWGSYCAFWSYLTYPRAAAAGVVLACAGTLGDLIESRFKRECDIKDSATFMPAGMGGFMDMFDSLLFAPALFYPYLYYCLVAAV